MVLDIRRGTKKDLEQVAAIHRASILELCADHYTKAQLSSWTEALTSESYKTLLDSRQFFVAFQTGKIKAFGILDLKESIINATYVSPTMVGQGLGRALVEKMENVAEQNCCTQIMLHSTLNAVGFYEALGYVKGTETRNRFPSGVELPCIVMTKKLRDNT